MEKEIEVGYHMVNQSAIGDYNPGIVLSIAHLIAQLINGKEENIAALNDIIFTYGLKIEKIETDRKGL